MVDTEAMDRVVTVAELRRVLDAYARTHGGRFLLFGSAAHGQMRYDSDVDILVEFPPDRQGAAWNFAERACLDRRRSPDLTTPDWCTEDFLALVRSETDAD